MCHLLIKTTSLITGSIFVHKSALRPPWSAVASARSGLIPMRPPKSPMPTPAKPFASWSPMASSFANKSLCTRAPVPESSRLREGSAGTEALGRGRVRLMPECQRRSCRYEHMCSVGLHTKDFSSLGDGAQILLLTCPLSTDKSCGCVAYVSFAVS